MELKLGDIVLDRYVLHAKLGEGGFGTVWQAVDRMERRPVAVKALHASATRLDRRRFEVEAGVLARLDHPNILKLHDFTAHEDGTLLLVTELLGRATLADWVRTGPPSVDDVISVTRQLCSALHAAHREGVLHRDLKPANVLIETDDNGRPHVTVLDFGIAKMVGHDQPDITKTGEILGTPGYMSPEQLRGLDVGPPTDLYCLGLLIFLMLEGRVAFKGATPLEIGMAHLTQPVPPVERGPVRLRSLVFALLEKDPDQRPGSAIAVQRLLAELTDDPPDLPVAPSSQSRTLIFVGAVLSVVVLLVAALLLSEGEEAEQVAVKRAPPSIVASEPTSSPNSPARHEAAKATLPRGCGKKWTPGRHDELMSLGLDDPHPRLLFYVPPAFDGVTPLPAVVLFHRRGSTAEWALIETRFEQVAAANNFIVIAPQSRRSVSSTPWVGGDQLFAESDFDWAADHLCIDTERMYLVGLSEGIAATEQLRCHHPAKFAAVVDSGARFSGSDSCRKKSLAEPIPRLEFADLQDLQVPVGGGKAPVPPCKAKLSRSVFDSLDVYEKKMQTKYGCTGEQRAIDVGSDDLTCHTWACETPYWMCRVDAGRPWSNQPWHTDQGCVGQANGAPRAKIAWEFLSKHALGASGANPADGLNKPP